MDKRKENQGADHPYAQGTPVQVTGEMLIPYRGLISDAAATSSGYRYIIMAHKDEVQRLGRACRAGNVDEVRCHSDKVTQIGPGPADRQEANERFELFGQTGAFPVFDCVRAVPRSQIVAAVRAVSEEIDAVRAAEAYPESQEGWIVAGKNATVSYGRYGWSVWVKGRGDVGHSILNRVEAITRAYGNLRGQS